MSNHPDSKRVKRKIGDTIVEYLDGANNFYAEALRRFVVRHCGAVAPESTGRCLRQLRKDRRLNYRVISHSDSYYQVIPVEPLDDTQLELSL